MSTTTNRQIKIKINGKDVADEIRVISREKRKLIADLEGMTRGSEEYIATISEIRRVDGILRDHRAQLSHVDEGYNLLSKGGITQLAGLAAGAFSVDVLISYGKHLFDLSGSMELLEQKARTVFAETFPQVTAAAEQNAAAMGLTTSQYVSAAAAVADLLIPMGFTRQEAKDMSVEMVNLSGALSEWTGGQISAEEVSKTLAKAMLGEREELKGLGIAISEEDVKNRLRQKGLQDLTGEYAQQAEAIATVELIMEKSVDAQNAYASGSDTIVRRQAELRAQLTSISEKLATVLLPVFEKLVNIAGSVVNALSDVGQGFAAIIAPAEASTDAFTNQADKVRKLEAELPKLLDRYEELKGKSNLSRTEQTELAKVIQRIGEITPTAITEIDNYGRALNINANASREFLAQEQKRLRFLNEEAISETFKQAKKLREQRDQLKSEIESGTALKGVRTGLGTQLQHTELTAEEIETRTTQLAKLTNKLQGARNQLKFLKGEALTEEPSTPAPSITPPPTSSTGSTSGGGSGKSKAQKEAEDLEKSQKELAEILANARREAELARLSDEEQAIEKLRDKYQQEIDLAIEGEKKKVAGATATRLELEILRDEAVQALITEQDLAREAKEKELFDAKVQKIGEQALLELEAKKAFQAEYNAFLQDEQAQAIAALDAHYQELLAKAREYGINTQALEAQLEAKRAEIKQKYQDDKEKKLKEQQAKAIQAQRDELNALGEAYTGLANVMGSAAGLLQGILGQNAAAAKAFALAEIAFSTASAIAKATASAAGQPFPANLIAVTTSIAAIFNAIGQAKKVLAEAPPLPQRYTGGFFDVKGQDDGRNYNARYLGQPDTGLLPPGPGLVLANERGPEFFVSNEDLRNPNVLNHVRAIENIRASRTGRVPQFAEGGSTATLPASAAGGDMAMAASAMASAVQALTAILGAGIVATLPDETVVAIVNRFRLLNRNSGGVL